MRASLLLNPRKNGYNPYFRILGQYRALQGPLISLQYPPFSCRQSRPNESKEMTTQLVSGVMMAVNGLPLRLFGILYM